jgi:N-acetylglucosamine-6-phosphate deacetylase
MVGAAMKGIVNGKLIIHGDIIENKLLVFQDRIVSIRGKVEATDGIELIDAKGCYVSPGFLDVHIHGAFGHDTMDGTEAISEISRNLCRFGVTGFLPTTITSDKESCHKALRAIKEAANVAVGAKVLGAHLEGPFINADRKGAHCEEFITRADYELIKDYIDVIKIITIAPEIEGNMDFIKQLCQHGNLTFSIGHSNATYEEAIAAIEVGVKSATHVFNAMSGLNHRQPGVVGAVLNSPIYCELIADKIHVHPALYRLLASIKGSERLILVTDSMRAACMKQGDYELGGQKVAVDGDSARLKDGTLAGSVLRLDTALKNLLEHSGLNLPQAIATITTNPANLIDMYDELGSLEVGKRADIVIFDEGINIKQTIVGGKLVWKG